MTTSGKLADRGHFFGLHQSLVRFFQLTIASLRPLVRFAQFGRALLGQLFKAVAVLLQFVFVAPAFNVKVA